MDTCENCKVIRDKRFIENIWDLGDMTRVRELSIEQLLVYSEDGLTWAHKTLKKASLSDSCKKAWSDLWKVKYNLSSNNFYKLMTYGCRCDIRHSPLHYLYLNCCNPSSKKVKKIVNWLEKENVKIIHKDSKGFTPQDYLKLRSFENQEQINELIGNYKEIENNNIINKLCQNFNFKKCCKCGCLLEFVSDLKKISANEIKNLVPHQFIQEAYQLRTTVNNFYETKKLYYKDQIRNHKFLINIYSTILS